MNTENLNTYSFSKLKTFSQCKYWYYLHYFDKSFKEEGHGTSEFGTFVHLILEKWGRGELETYELLPYYEEHYAENVVSDFTLYLSSDYCKDFGERYYQSGYEFLKNFTGFDFTIVDTEKYFVFDYKDKFNINGKIDLIATDEHGNLIVVDYKSKGNWKSKAERIEYEKQLYFYAYAIHEIYGKWPTKMAFFMFRIDKWSWVEFNKETMEEVLSWAEHVVNEIESEIDFTSILEENNGEWDFFCNNFCGARNVCKYKSGGQICE